MSFHLDINVTMHLKFLYAQIMSEVLFTSIVSCLGYFKVFCHTEPFVCLTEASKYFSPS